MGRLKFVIPLLVLLLIFGLTSGCARIPNPEKTVEEFWSALKSGDYEKAEYYISEDIDEKFIQEMFWLDESEEMFTDEIVKAFMERVNLFTEGHEIENDTAIVQVVVEWPNMELLFGKFIGEALGVAFTAALGGATDEELDTLLKPIFLEVLEETPDIQTNHEVELVLIDGEWKLTTSPVPDSEDVFDLSDFTEEGFGKTDDEKESGELETITEYTMEQPIQIDAGKLQKLMGEPELTGDLEIIFLSINKSTSIEDDLYGTVNAEGVFATVYYSFSNGANSRVQPSTQFNDLFVLMDSADRRWEPAGYLSHGSDIAAAFTLKEGYSDPKAWISPGFTRTTAISFDIPEQAEGLRLWSEKLAIIVKLED